MKHLAADAIVITSLGMRSSLGDTVTACAAARAGMSAGQELGHFLVFDEDGVEEGAIGHPVLTAAGFQGAAKLLCLAWPALEDALQREDLRSFDHERTGLYICLTDPKSRRPPTGGNGATPAKPGPPFGDTSCARLMRLAALGIPPSNWTFIANGHAGVVRAILEASTKLKAGHWHRCFIGGVDSLLDNSTLQYLQDARRLKTASKPDGLQPGEAGAFVVLERFDFARRRRAEILAVVAGGSVTANEGHADGEDRGDGAADLAKAVLRLLEAAGAPTAEELWLISDHNGEHRRASELGNLIVNLSGKVPDIAARPLWFPAASFGDTGAASGAIAICMAARSFARGYPNGPSALILSSSDRGARGALRIDSVSGDPT
jgi:3-oxoacyl-[acyl-carrier-protein] synthase-1